MLRICASVVALSLLLPSFTGCAENSNSSAVKGKGVNPLITTAPIPGFDSAKPGLVGDISKEDYKEIIGGVMDIYVPLARDRNANLYLRAPGDPLNPGNEHINDVTEEYYSRDEVLDRMWGIKIPNAHATKNTATNTWYLTINGGLARQSELQAEALTLIVCHEIGHYFGGFPLSLVSSIVGVHAIPLATEGQSDYYASQVCAKQAWQGLDNSTDRMGNTYKYLAGTVSSDRCDLMYISRDDRNLCYKIAYAGTQAATLWHRFNPVTPKPPTAGTPDNTQVMVTKQMLYPEPQCRLDTYLNGALCPTETERTGKIEDKIIYDLRKIPGIDHPDAPDSIKARDASKDLTCGVRFTERARPRCWFHPEYYSDSLYSDLKINGVRLD